MKLNSNSSQRTNTKNLDIESTDIESRDKLTLIEETLLESVSGGSAEDDGICSGHQFCEVDPPKNSGY